MNVMEELDSAIKGAGKTKDDILWAIIDSAPYTYSSIYNGDYAGPYDNEIHSGLLNSDNVYKELHELFKDVVYDSGYGAQELFGVVVFKDGSWLERSEYDGSEQWDYKHTPDISKYIKG